MANIKEDVTLVITSCNRPNELLKTIESFFKYNTYSIKNIIIIDDSGINNCIDNCLKLIPSNINSTIIYNKHNIGQIKSIDKAYSLVETKYIFHCEDDWEFYEKGFIEKSLDILKLNDKILNVWLREYKNFVVLRNGHPINKQIIDNKYRVMSSFKERTNIWSGFSFNPGLRRLNDYKLFSPYSQFINSDKCGVGGVEQALSRIYNEHKYISAITLNEKGFVKHIGWHNSTQT
jgi:hypothetical protein